MTTPILGKRLAVIDPVVKRPKMPEIAIDSDYYACMLENEKRYFSVIPDYLGGCKPVQYEFTPENRAILVNWMVGSKWRLQNHLIVY